jgi:hypothetical protein
MIENFQRWFEIIWGPAMDGAKPCSVTVPTAATVSTNADAASTAGNRMGTRCKVLTLAAFRQ